MRTGLALFAFLCSVVAAWGSCGGERFDASPFGFTDYDEGGGYYEVRWAEPRKVESVVLEFEEEQEPAADGKLQVQYWHRVWDGLRDEAAGERNTADAGWDKMDDWTNGKWIDAVVKAKFEGEKWEFDFEPVTGDEIKGIEGEGVRYRKTLKVRVYCEGGLAKPDEVRVYTSSVYRPVSARIEFGRPALEGIKGGCESGRLEVFNGGIVAVRAGEDSKALLEGENSWRLGEDGCGVIEADLLMVVDRWSGEYDRTIVTVRSGSRSFSFSGDEVACGERIFVDDLGVLVTDVRDGTGLEEYRAKLEREFAGKTVYERLKDHEEQTLFGAWEDMPLKRPLYFVHALPGNRNSMRQRPNGEICVMGNGRWFDMPRSPKDTLRKHWKGRELTVSLGFPDSELRGGRELKEGYLPVLRTWWQDGSVYYEQTTFLDAMDGDLSDITVDDPTVLLMRVRVVNTSDKRVSNAKLRFTSSSEGEGKLIVRGIRGIASKHGTDYIRFLMNDCGRGSYEQEEEGTVWSLRLKPGEGHNLYFAVPSITPSTDKEIYTLRKRQFGKSCERICKFWRELTEKGTEIVTPERWLNDFYKAHLRHVLVNCFKEPGSEVLHAHVGTLAYGVYANESIMMITDLDRRGYHEAARRVLESFLKYQGRKSLPGNFSSFEGVFNASGGHETLGYNKNHGYVMWGMSEHWRFTRDRKWMGEKIDKLVKACEWVIRERKATMRMDESGERVPYYGWLPAGSLEDVEDYWYWTATNAATVWGFQSLADAMCDFGYEAGEMFKREAEAYNEDFMRGVLESRITSPVVRLRDATYVPKIPSRVYERGRAEGWIRETLEGSILIPAYGLFAPDEPETEWIIKDYEDNLYISEEYGYCICNFERFWFSRGGFSMQANLLDGPLVYLWRDEIKHYLRAYFNGFASAFYPEVRMCSEHSSPELGYSKGDHFKSSDEAQLTYWLRLMFLNERGEELYLCQAIPRYWLSDGEIIGISDAPTHFGGMSVGMESRVDSGFIRAVVSPPRRNPPEKIYVRFRHPDKAVMKRVTVNGQEHKDFNKDKEWVVLSGEWAGDMEIVVKY